MSDASAQPKLTPDGFVAEMKELGVAVAPEAIVELQAYEALLTQWQARMNLIGNSTLPDIWRRHFFDSAQLYPLLPANDTDSPRKLKVYDLGSGAGFPGLVLAILAKRDVNFPGGRPLRLQLVEADRRKAAFLTEAVRVLDLSADNASKAEVRVRAQRAEVVEPQIVDTVTARALAPLERLLETASRFADAKTILLFPKGQSVEAELLAADKAWKMARDLIASRSDARGTILRISGLQRR